MRAVFLPLSIAALFGAFYAIVVERHWWAVRRFSVPCLPVGMEPLRILHLTDLHFRSGQGLKRRFLKTLSSEKWDVVVITGDLLGDPRSNEAVVSALKPIQAEFAKLFVLGSNDYYSPAFKNPLKYFKAKGHGKDAGSYKSAGANPWRDLVERLESEGWRLLQNVRTTLQLSDIEVELVGLDDAHIGRANPEVAEPRRSEGFRLAIAHSPDSARDLMDKDFDLILCGHTHGGQVCLPFFGALVTNCDIPRAWAKGLHRQGRSWLHVSAGLGTSMFAPYRFACRPEVSVLELIPR